MNMGNISLTRILEAQDGREYGFWAFEGPVPPASEIRDIIEILGEQGISDWGIGDIERELVTRGYSVQFVDTVAEYCI